jgi:hypothetical protein
MSTGLVLEFCGNYIHSVRLQRHQYNDSDIQCLLRTEVPLLTTGIY